MPEGSIVCDTGPLVDEETAQVWVEEAERRAEAIDRDEVQTLAHEDVMSEARSRLG